MSAAIAIAAATAAAQNPAPTDSPPFQPAELSIGEPIALPYGNRATASPGAAAAALTPGNDPRAALPPAAAPETVPGNGWLGLAVAESNVPGRWRVDEVTAGGPAARAGIAVGDELRAVNGSTLASAEDVSQALTAIAAGQDVSVAVARGERVTDIVLRAEPRPVARTAAPEATAAAPAQLAGSSVDPAPAPLAQSQTDATPAWPARGGEGWQAADEGPPVPAASRFSQQATATPAPPSVIAPAREPAPAFAPTPGPAAVPTPSTPPAFAATAPFNAAAAPPGRFVPPAATAAAPQTTTGRTALGVRTVPIDPATQARFRLPQPAGAYVIGVVEGLPAGQAGVPPGSVIVAVGDQPVRTPHELTRLVTSSPLDRPVTVEFVLPGGEAKRTNVVLQSLDAPLERAIAGDAGTADAPPNLRPAPAPRRAERPASGDGIQPDVRAEIRSEIRALRGRLERLERLLDPGSRSGR